MKANRRLQRFQEIYIRQYRTAYTIWRYFARSILFAIILRKTITNAEWMLWSQTNEHSFYGATKHRVAWNDAVDEQLNEHALSTFSVDVAVCFLIQEIAENMRNVSKTASLPAHCLRPDIKDFQSSDFIIILLFHPIAPSITTKLRYRDKRGWCRNDLE